MDVVPRCRQRIPSPLVETEASRERSLEAAVGIELQAILALGRASWTESFMSSSL